MTDNTSNDLRDSEIALMDAIKSLMEILLHANIATPRAFDHIFTNQRDGYLAKQMPRAAAVMELLRQFATSPEREEHRQTLRQLLAEPPQGSA